MNGMGPIADSETVVVVGNPAGDTRYVGPFDHDSEATEWCIENDTDDGSTFNIYTLNRPAASPVALEDQQ